jgi:hypothetical protein
MFNGFPGVTETLRARSNYDLRLIQKDPRERGDSDNDAMKALQQGFARMRAKPQAQGGAAAIWNSLSDVTLTRSFPWR